MILPKKKSEKESAQSQSATNLSHKSKGFTIIELLIVLIFLTAIISSIIPLLTKAIATNRNTKDKLLAYQAANTEVENMRNSDFDTLADYNFNLTNISNATGTVDISDQIDGQTETDIIQATVTVAWLNGEKNENVQLITYIAKYGID